MNAFCQSWLTPLSIPMQTAPANSVLVPSSMELSATQTPVPTVVGDPHFWTIVVLIVFAIYQSRR